MCQRFANTLILCDILPPDTFIRKINFFVVYIINHIHPFLNIPKKSNLLINVSGWSSWQTKVFHMEKRDNLSEKRLDQGIWRWT
jgi:hypothetical protein